MDVIHDPIHHASYAFLREGDTLWVTTWLEDGGHLPEHFHPSLDERWEVVDGTASVKVDGAWRDVTPADGPLLVARGVRHELRNTSGAVAHLRCEVTPAGDLEEFLVESARGAREGLYTRHGLPTSRRGAAWIAQLALRHRHETVLCSPPPAVQRLLLPLLARMGPTPRTA
jgi:mannose-6-phosphate isomerase-like protein (cupin superfamily)